VEYRELTPVEIVPLPEGFHLKARTVNEAGTLRIYSQVIQRLEKKI